ncbi:hypothetical protein M3Y99_01431700 [Aphelenchoides fujianensis]|nr:hypothetical protein M3Y99_01431700 [Aphelenchoides fujianensis]
MFVEHFVPSTDVVTQIVLPTIIFCIGMVVAMLIGINKCKQWELDKIVEMRRTRRVIQRITARLQEKNYRTIQKARTMRQRKRAVAAAAAKANTAPPTYTRKAGGERRPSEQPASGNSPPPSYEDSLLDSLYFECMPPQVRSKSVHK